MKEEKIEEMNIKENIAIEMSNMNSISRKNIEGNLLTDNITVNVDSDHDNILHLKEGNYETFEQNIEGNEEKDDIINDLLTYIAENIPKNETIESMGNEKIRTTKKEEDK
eukprot:300569_1